ADIIQAKLVTVIHHWQTGKSERQDGYGPRAFLPVPGGNTRRIVVRKGVNRHFMITKCLLVAIDRLLKGLRIPWQTDTLEVKWHQPTGINVTVEIYIVAESMRFSVPIWIRFGNK